MLQSSSLHIAIVMDGTGRWARRRGLPRVAGHRAGAEAVRRTVEAAPELGVAALTLYAFSADNWKRPPGEVAALMRLLARYLRTETPRLVQNGVRLELIGRRDRLPVPLVAAIDAAERATARGARLHLRLAVDYSSRRSEEHTSELQSPCNLVCRLLLEKKNTNTHCAPSLTPI